MSQCGAVIAALLALSGCAHVEPQPCPDYDPARLAAIATTDDVGAACGDAASLGCEIRVGDESVLVLPRRAPAWLLQHEARHVLCGEWHAEDYVDPQTGER